MKGVDFGVNTERKGVRLLKSGFSGIRQLFFSRMTIVLILLVLNIFLLISIFLWFEDYIAHYFGGSTVIAVTMVLHLNHKRMEPETKMCWLTVVLLFPVFGTLLYLFTSWEIGARILRNRVQKVVTQSKENHGEKESLVDFSQMDSGAAALCQFVCRAGSARVYTNTHMTYLPVGERMLEALLAQLEQAEKYIYMEYFSISEGDMWGQILEVLERKAQQGVDVRVMYDGICELMLLPKDYPKRMKELGIRCKVFAPLSPFLSTHYNYRDHRKITVIDGKVAFNGGINLCDEYINVGSKFGHWKDMAVMLRGDAVEGFTRLFLEMWNLDEREFSYVPMPEKVDSGNGFVMPFGDNPLDEIPLGKRVYVDLLNRAQKEVFIMTPYLIIDHEIESALCYAAARGVRVVLLLPGIEDKYIPYAIAKTHYPTLLRCGVEIYEYSPGFTHGKMMICDGEEALLGTINFDYRSFCHHFECGTYLYECDCIRDMIMDYEECLQRSRKVTWDTVKKEKWHRKLAGYLMKPFAPLL